MDFLKFFRGLWGGQAGVHKFGLTQKYNNIYKELIYLTGEEGGLRYESAEGYHRQEADVHGMKGGGGKKRFINNYITLIMKMF